MVSLRRAATGSTPAPCAARSGLELQRRIFGGGAAVAGPGFLFETGGQRREARGGRCRAHYGCPG